MRDQQMKPSMLLTLLLFAWLSIGCGGAQAPRSLMKKSLLIRLDDPTSLEGEANDDTTILDIGLGMDIQLSVSNHGEPGKFQCKNTWATHSIIGTHAYDLPQPSGTQSINYDLDLRATSSPHDGFPLHLCSEASLAVPSPKSMSFRRRARGAGEGLYIFGDEAPPLRVPPSKTLEKEKVPQESSSYLPLFSLHFERDIEQRILAQPLDSRPTSQSILFIGSSVDQLDLVQPKLGATKEQALPPIITMFTGMSMDSQVVATYEHPKPRTGDFTGPTSWKSYYKPVHSYSQALQRHCRLTDFEIEVGSLTIIGGFGAVSTVIDKTSTSGKRYAMKRVSAAKVAAHPECLLAEETIQNSLFHPNIVKHYCTMVDECNGDVCFLLELVEGITLHQLVVSANAMGRQRLGEQLVGNIIAQITIALRHLYVLGIAHRDVKPYNIMLTNSMQVKLLDFGLATTKNSITPTRELAGTPLYLAPEALTDHLSTDSRAEDLYALGLVSYFLVTGRHYFGSSNDNQLALLAHRRTKLFAPIKMTSSGSLNDLLAILLDSNPVSRLNNVYAHFEDFTRLSIFSGVDWDRLGATKIV